MYALLDGNNIIGLFNSPQSDENGEITTTQISDLDSRIDPFLNMPILRAQIQQALIKSDLVATRCFKSGVAFPSEWQNYVIELRGSPIDLPIQPAYPEGT